MQLWGISILVVGLLLSSAAPALGRKWTSSTGKFSVEAELVEAKDGNVLLRRQDSKIITVPDASSNQFFIMGTSPSCSATRRRR